MCWFLLGMGISFELPLVLLTLVKIGLLDATKLSKFRMYWVVGGLVLAGFITPDGNPLTMVIMFLPLHFLYEVSVVVAWWWARKERLAAERGEG
jgi:sec-independent protein translocase protein TatC